MGPQRTKKVDLCGMREVIETKATNNSRRKWSVYGYNYHISKSVKNIYVHLNSDR
jgi:hypothetical protein